MGYYVNEHGERFNENSDEAQWGVHDKSWCDECIPEHGGWCTDSWCVNYCGDLEYVDED